MLHLGEIFAAIAHHHRAEEFRIAANIVIVAGIETGTVGLVPELLRPEMAALEDRPLVAVFRPVLDMAAGLQDEDVGAGTRKGRRDRRPADA
jgi:hypothetical protein